MTELRYCNFLEVIDCGTPRASDGSGVVLEYVNDTRFGTVIAFHCEGVHTPVTAVCGSSGEWSPNPALLTCVNGTFGKQFKGISLQLSVYNSIT